MLLLASFPARPYGAPLDRRSENEVADLKRSERGQLPIGTAIDHPSFLISEREGAGHSSPKWRCGLVAATRKQDGAFAILAARSVR
jgi:hypothetical protein